MQFGVRTHKREKGLMTVRGRVTGHTPPLCGRGGGGLFWVFGTGFVFCGTDCSLQTAVTTAPPGDPPGPAQRTKLPQIAWPQHDEQQLRCGSRQSLNDNATDTSCHINDSSLLLRQFFKL